MWGRAPVAHLSRFEAFRQEEGRSHIVEAVSESTNNRATRMDRAHSGDYGRSGHGSCVVRHLSRNDFGAR